MSEQTPIRYRDFWDVPRIFLAAHNGLLFLFDCPFDEEKEDYPDRYKVYVLPDVPEEDLAGSWDKLASRATCYVGEVPVKAVRFDPSKRQAVSRQLLEELAGRLGPGHGTQTARARP